MPEKSLTADRLPVPAEQIERRIYLIRGQKVMLDSDLATLYRVLTKNLNLAVRRNADRFPEDFMFQLTKEEFDNLKLQIATSSSGYGGRRYLPYAFTELGVAMLSSVLHSERAVQMNILIMRTFVKLRQALAANQGLAGDIERLKATQRQHAIALVEVIKEIRRLKAPRKSRPQIGFYIGRN